jgi:hypothetical protein
MRQWRTAKLPLGMQAWPSMEAPTIDRRQECVPCRTETMTIKNTFRKMPPYVIVPAR